MNNVLEKIFEAPAVLLEKSVSGVWHVKQLVIDKKPLKHAEEYWNTLGPGLTTGAADDDPSGIATYSQTGAQYGFQLLWLAGFTFPLMAIVQEMCARIGAVTGKGLAANIRERYSAPVLYVTTTLLFAANTFNIGADLGAIAQAVQLLDPHLAAGFLIVVFAAGSLLLQIYTTYARYAKYLKYLALVLFAYVLSALLCHLDWSQVALRSVVPSITFSKNQIILICGILGTTISPYLFFWQSSQEVEEQNLKMMNGNGNGTNTCPVKRDLRHLKIDIWTGMFFSNAAMFFIIAACAGTLFASGITNIMTAADAAAALRPLAGDAAYFLFAIGIIGTGMLAIPVLAGSAAYAIAESFEWKQGLYRNLKEAYAFYGVIIISMLMGLALNFVGLDPMKALIYSAVANGLVAPVVLVLIVLLSSNKEIMQEYVNHPAITWLGWLVTAIMVIAGGATIMAFV